jgi:hypothetical protein
LAVVLDSEPTVTGRVSMDKALSGIRVIDMTESIDHSPATAISIE